MRSFLIFLLSLSFLALSSTASARQHSLDETPIRQAKLYEQQHNYQQAADMYWITAKRLGSATGQPWLAKAAEMAWFAGNIDEAKQILNETQEAQMNEHSLALTRLIAARIARREGQYDSVLQLLSIAYSNTPPRMQQEISALRDEALEKGGNLPRTAQARTGDPQKSREKWASLVSQTPGTLAHRLTLSPNREEKGWLELAYLYQSDADDPEELQRNLRLWKRVYQGHPAGTDILPLLQPDGPTTAANSLRKPDWNVSPQVQTIAVLLPTSGPLATIGNVILDGIMAARFDKPNVSVRVYDSGAAENDIYSLYQTAVYEGAELILGPMQKTLVDALATQPLTVPVIALNSGKQAGSSNGNLLQFALLPEDEATQAAKKMLADGYTQLAVLTPKGEWGQRIAQAFLDAAQAGGAEIVARGHYDPKANDHANEIARLLKPDKKNNVNGVGAQALFLVATPKQARIIVPMVKFYFLDSLPVYATSHAFSGETNTNADRDLNGLTYSEIPWLLNPDASPAYTDLHGAARAHPRLFAFGYDALNAVPKLVATDANERVTGLSGILSVDFSNRVHRQLDWARFRRGAPQLVQAATLERQAATLAP